MGEVDYYMDAHTQGVGELIEHQREFAVPDHQRDFAWGEGEVEQLILDVTRALRESTPDYFLGLIVLVKQESKRQLLILDGQQRLATITMIYAGIREWLHAAGRQKDAQQIQFDYIGLVKLGTNVDRPRLTLNINDREIFQSLVVDRENDATLKKRRDVARRYSSQRRVAKAALICRQRVEKFAAESGSDTTEQASALYELAEYIRDSVKVVTMNVSSEINAYAIFESLNDRGLDLSVLDLVKNHLFGRAGSRLEKVKHNWAQMTAHLGDRPADEFLKVFWTSRYGRIQRGKLFQEWRERFDGLSASKVVNLTTDLIVAADRFAALDSADDEIWREYSKKFRGGIRDLALIGNRQMRPILLAALTTFEPKELEKLVERLVIATFRYQNVGKKRTGALEIGSARTAKSIADKSSATATDAWSQLVSIVPDDDDFKSDFARYSESKPQIAKYVLGCLEREVRQREVEMKSELEPSKDLTLEHVLPKNPAGAWSKVLVADPDIVDYTARLGNLCLLNEAMNKKAANEAFEKKAADIYSRSSLLLTARIAEKYNEWNRTTIRDHQDYLATLATSIWPLP